MTTSPCTTMNLQDLECVLSVVRTLPGPLRAILVRILDLSTMSTLDITSPVQDALDFRSALSSGMDIALLPFKMLAAEIQSQMQQLYNVQNNFADCPAVDRAFGLMRQKLDKISSYVSGNEAKKAVMDYYLAAESQKQQEATAFLTNLAACVQYYANQIGQAVV